MYILKNEMRDVRLRCEREFKTFFQSADLARLKDPEFVYKAGFVAAIAQLYFTEQVRANGSEFTKEDAVLLDQLLAKLRKSVAAIIIENNPSFSHVGLIYPDGKILTGDTMLQATVKI